MIWEKAAQSVGRHREDLSYFEKIVRRIFTV
jgi:hypothetical protein